MFESLVKLFNAIAKKCGKFAHGASIQRKENFHHVTTSRAPKIRCYGLSESGEFRVAASVRSINIGPGFTKNVGTVISRKVTEKFLGNMILRPERKSELHWSADCWDCSVECPKNRARSFRSHMVSKQGRI